ncbi:hypothetical protein F5878DRAFT_395136 [Lentinula raphanica]|uniref:Uncharacterized protein n=1 Tax=Lentinula raphanica TaxID=153919 RepID=A0AA38PGC8_9AGAR|nr:hypothetical protein F5878DRAFT_395136 [Lentinula raphanica]
MKTMSSSPSQLSYSPSPPSSPSTIVQPSSSPSIILSSPSVPNLNSFIPPPPPPTPTPARTRTRAARVALQNVDDTYNAVVITALEDIPFCCHEDLLTMSRAQLIAVARSLNAKLPAVMRIDTSDQRTDVFIRKSIEVLVGISKPILVGSRTTTLSGAEPPGAPRAVKTRKVLSVEEIENSTLENSQARWDTPSGEDAHIDRSALWSPSSPGPLSSPLAKRAIIRSTRVARSSELGTLATTGTPKLARLEEEDESISPSTHDSETQDGQRDKKRRKYSDSGFSTGFPARKGMGFRRWSGSLVRGSEDSRHSSSVVGNIYLDNTMDVDDSPSRSVKLQAYTRRSSLRPPFRQSVSTVTRPFHTAYNGISSPTLAGIDTKRRSQGG